MAALENVPTEEDLRAMLGDNSFAAWNADCSLIDSLYDVDKNWNDGGKKWDIEYKYRRGGKTLCALYAAPGRFGIMLIFGKNERQKFDSVRSKLSGFAQSEYDAAETYHDGKWVMFSDRITASDLKTLLAIKRKPNK